MAAISFDVVVELFEAVPLEEVLVAVVVDDELDEEPDAEVSEPAGVPVPDEVVLLEADVPPAEEESVVVAVPLVDGTSLLVEGAGPGV